MSYPINYPTPQGANIQIFRTGGGPPYLGTSSDWVKPQGASFVWFTLIGCGGSGDTSSYGGQSGAVTNFMCPAFLIPDVLRINVGASNSPGSNGSDTTVVYQQKDGTGYTLLTAKAGGSGSLNNATAMTANAFTAMGFFQSVAGQTGSNGSQSASTTTFLGGGSTQISTSTGNYGYSTTGGNPNPPGNGLFQMQPIIVGVGGAGDLAGKGVGGIGCGGSVNDIGGPGMVVIITW